jgi:hypothetical protein
VRSRDLRSLAEVHCTRYLLTGSGTLTPFLNRSSNCNSGVVAWVRDHGTFDMVVRKVYPLRVHGHGRAPDFLIYLRPDPNMRRSIGRVITRQSYYAIQFRADQLPYTTYESVPYFGPQHLHFCQMTLLQWRKRHLEIQTTKCLLLICDRNWSAEFRDRWNSGDRSQLFSPSTKSIGCTVSIPDFSSLWVHVSKPVAILTASGGRFTGFTDIDSTSLHSLWLVAIFQRSQQIGSSSAFLLPFTLITRSDLVSIYSSSSAARHSNHRNSIFVSRFPWV